MKPFDSSIEKFLTFLPNLLSGLLVILLFLVIWFIAKKSTSHLTKHFGDEKEYIAKLISRTINIVVIIVGFITTLDVVGINISGLIASLGLTGFAIGFALKDVLSNVARAVQF